MGSDQAASIKFIMDSILSKFIVTVFYAQEMIGLSGDIEKTFPESYIFESEGDRISQALDLDSLASTALSVESQSAINAAKNAKLINNQELLSKMNKADDDALRVSSEIV